MHPKNAEPALPARDRILEAALRRFSSHSYEETGLRDIAADARADVAYVHRCFGSKEQLFARAIGATVRPEQVLSGPIGNVAQNLTDQLFARDAVDTNDKVYLLDIVVRSLSSSDATRVLREVIQQDFIAPLAERLERPAQLRAALIAAFLAGVGIFRNVLGIEPLAETQGKEVERLVMNAITDIMCERQKGASDGQAST
jgi:AcrR family transcriptional regulator